MHVTIIAKAPVAGTVKTRLCPPCTYHQAADLAAAALGDTFDAVEESLAGADVRTVLLLEGERPMTTPSNVEVVVQHGDGLEERLMNGFLDLGPGLIIGMETPGAAAAVGDAVAWLRRGINVLGLALDGGYWAIGLTAVDKTLVREIFDDIPMSQSHTGIAQLRRLQCIAGAVRLLPMARDLDSIEDLHSVADSKRPGRLSAVAASVIASFG